jgi:hypothetical protein
MQRSLNPIFWRWRSKWLPAVIILVLYGLDWVILGHQASQTQKETERVLADLPLPTGTTQVAYHSRYDPNGGYAERTLASKASAQEICDFYLSLFELDDWTLKKQDCRPDPDHLLLEFRKGDTACRIHLQYGAREERYSMRCDWVHWPPW